MTAIAYIGFGANLGDRRATFNKALEAFSELSGIAVVNYSKLYETDPVDLSDNGSRFLNAVVAIETELSPSELASKMREVELRLGKSPKHKSNLSRVIDLDLLLFGNQIVREDGLLVPHPRMHQREFVLLPLAEIAPDVVHPTSGLTISKLLYELSESAIRPTNTNGSSMN